MASQATYVAHRPVWGTHFVFTLNNFDKDHDYKAELLNTAYQVKRAIVGREVGPTSEIPHLQGYVQLIRDQRITFVK